MIKHWFPQFSVTHRMFHDVCCLRHLRPRQMASISQMIFSNAFSIMKMVEFRLKLHWNLFPRGRITIGQHWFRQWLGVEHAANRHLTQWLPSLMTHVCIARPQWVSIYFYGPLVFSSEFICEFVDTHGIAIPNTTRGLIQGAVLWDKCV